MFDDFIRNKANEHQAPVPPDAWHNIIKQQKKKRFGFFWWSSIVLLVGGLSVTGYLISKKQNGNNIVTTAENKTAPAKKETTGNRLQPAATNINTETPLPGKQTTAGNDNHPAVTNIDPAKNNTGVTQVGTNTVTYKGDKNIESNKGKLLADNGRKKKHIKGKLQYNNTGSDPEEINEGAENKNLPAEQMDITAAQSATTINTVIPGSTTNQTPVDKTATVITNQEKSNHCNQHNN
ncbi:MAG: hypothetical protein IPP72_04005 [Chitinophagaceae bacterium]|nr:hypothetical protein [Chitinophagaceae bacterium]